MTFSNLVSGTVPHHGKYSSRGGNTISRVILHHWAGTAGGDARLMNPNEEASANYIVYSDGRIVGQVPEEYRAWTSGSAYADNPSITVEIQNSTVAPTWEISPQAMNAVVALVADIAKNYNWGSVAANQLRGHREFFATACPGPYVWERIGTIRERVNADANASVEPTLPVPTGKTVSQLADEVLQGLYGNGDARRQALGANYDAVQAEVNRRIMGAPIEKTIDQLADEVIAGVYGNGSDRAAALGGRYNEVQARVNEKLGVLQPVPASTGVDITRMANAVIRGDYGNGDARRQALGANYDAVQAEVTRILG